MGTGTRSQVAALVIILGFSIVIPLAGLSSELSPEQMLAVLKAKDAQFDNAKLTYESWWQRSTKGLADVAKSFVAHYSEQLVVRGPEVTILAEAMPDSESVSLPDGSRVGTTGMQKSSNAKGTLKILTGPASKDSHNEDSTNLLEIWPLLPESDSMKNLRRLVEFAHGFGFGKCMSAVESVERKGEMTLVIGIGQFSAGDSARFALEIDEGFVVRKASIEVRTGTERRYGLTRYEVETEGTSQAGRMTVAQSGRTVETKVGVFEDGKHSGASKVMKDFRVRFTGYESHLSDAEYARLTDMTPTAGTHVKDNIAGTYNIVPGSGTSGVEGPASVVEEEPVHSADDTSVLTTESRVSVPADVDEGPSKCALFLAAAALALVVILALVFRQIKSRKAAR